jgi:tetratricopeptide (TPR) repeat protein
MQGGTADASALSFPVGQRIGNALISYVLYLGKSIWPLDLYPFYPHRGANLSLTEIAFSIALLAALTAAALLLRGRRPWILAGWLWYLGTLVPVIGLVQAGEPGMADRYSYLPSIGLLIAVTGEARATANRWLRGPRLAGAALATLLALLASLSLLTWKQTKYWEDTETLGRRMLAGKASNSSILNVLGAASYQRGDSAQAVAILSRAVELRPGYLDAHFNLGLALAGRGLPDEAARQFTAVLNARPGDVETLANRGRALLDQRLAEPALRDFDTALAVSPDHPQILLLRGLALAQLNRHADAVATFLKVAALTPGSAEARYHLGRVYDTMGRPVEAIASYGNALKLRPDFAAAHNNLGVTLVGVGRVSEALPHFQQAVRLLPSYAEARENLEKARRALEPPARSPAPPRAHFPPTEARRDLR